MKEPFLDGEDLARKAMEALRKAVAAVVEEHRRSGRPLAVWRDGKVVMELPPPLGETADDSAAALESRV